MKAMKSLAILPVLLGVKHADFMAMHQNVEEQFRAFATRIRGKAETCEFMVSHRCTCGKESCVSYKDGTIRDVLLAGTADLNIRHEALSVEGMRLKSVNEVTAFVEGKEMTRNARTSSSNSAIFSFKRTSTLRSDMDIAQKDKRHQTLPPSSTTCR